MLIIFYYKFRLYGSSENGSALGPLSVPLSVETPASTKFPKDDTIKFVSL